MKPSRARARALACSTGPYRPFSGIGMSGLNRKNGRRSRGKGSANPLAVCSANSASMLRVAPSSAASCRIGR